MPETLEIEATDVSGVSFEDILGELLTEDVEAIGPLFQVDAEDPDSVTCGSFCTCDVCGSCWPNC
jgi:hypothetical protein